MNANGLRFALRTVAFLDSIADEPRGLVELGAGRLLVWHPEALGRIFRADKDMRLASSDTLRPLVGDRSLLFANGPRHRAYRRVVGDRLRGNRADYRDTIAEATEHAVRDLLCAGGVSLPDWTRLLTLRIIARIVLGDTPDALLRMFTTWVEGALGTRRRTLLYRYFRVHAPSPWRTFLRRRADVEQCLLATVRRNRPGTLVDPLRDPDGPLGELDDGELRDQVVSLLFAGHETTASAIAATLFWLERHPGIRDGIRDELAATGDDGSSADRVPLLDAACRESLRLSPPAMLAGNRVPGEDIRLLDRPVAAGTELTPCIYLAHRQYPNPGTFDPGRFAGARHSGHEYLPFGGGTRRCLGADLAMLELRMVVAAVLRRVDLTCVNPRAGRPSVRGPAMGVGRDLRMVTRPCRR